MDMDYFRNTTHGQLRLRIRPIRPSDKQKLASGFARLSAESRYHRFFCQKTVLTEDELRRFTELDGNDHFALGAFELSETGDEGDAVGVARFIRFAEELDAAELAIAVVDDRQRRGIGGTLLQRLLVAARERGIKRIHFHVLAQNNQMRRLVESVFSREGLRREGSVLVGNLPTPDLRPNAPPTNGAVTKADVSDVA